jgi:hypothetical protein
LLATRIEIRAFVRAAWRISLFNSIDDLVGAFVSAVITNGRQRPNDRGEPAHDRALESKAKECPAWLANGKK